MRVGERTGTHMVAGVNGLIAFVAKVVHMAELVAEVAEDEGFVAGEGEMAGAAVVAEVAHGCDDGGYDVVVAM